MLDYIPIVVNKILYVGFCGLYLVVITGVETGFLVLTSSKLF